MVSGTVEFLEDPKKNSGIIKLFQISMALTTIFVTKIGFITGSNIWNERRKNPHPSRVAASSISLGTLLVKLQNVITVNGSAAPCRPRNAKLVQKYKRALGAQEKAAITKEGAELAYADLYEKYPYLNITEWSVADVNGDLAQCGLSGSPTKVKTIQNISFQAKESKTLTGSDQDVEDLIVELLANHTIG